MENSDVMKWIVILDGPASTPFVGGKFRVALDFSDNYPFKYPKINFKTKIYHPNIKSDTGEICTLALDSVWVPTLTLRESFVTVGAVVVSVCTPALSPIEAFAVGAVVVSVCAPPDRYCTPLNVASTADQLVTVPV